MTRDTAVINIDVGDAHGEWEAQCDTVLGEAIAALARYNGSLSADNWRAVETRGPITVSRFANSGDGGGADTTIRLVGTGYIHGRLEDITRALYCDSDDDLVGCEAVLSGVPVLDGAVLQAMETRGPETPFRFAGVKWCASQAGGVDHDLLTFERMGVTLDSDNTELAYHVVYSIPDHPEWPTAAQLRAGSSIFRQRLASPELQRLEPFVLCYLYRRVSEALVLCYILGEYWGTGGSLSHAEAQRLLTGRILMVGRAVESCEAKILTKMTDHCRSTPEQLSKTCLRCRVTRRTVSEPLKLCGICRKSVCRACVVLKPTCRIDARTRLAETEAFCTRCLVRSNIPVNAATSTTRNGQATPASSHRDHRQRHHCHRNGTSTEIYARGRGTQEASRARRQVVLPHPSHAYNYDTLLRRASSGSWTSTVSSKSSADGKARSASSLPDPHGVLDGATGANRVLSLESTSSRSYDNLYHLGSHSASGEAERRYQLHRERVRRLCREDLELPRDRVVVQANAPPTSPDPRHERTHRERRRPQNPSGLPATAKTSPATAKPKAIRDFYRDLYTEL